LAESLANHTRVVSLLWYYLFAVHNGRWSHISVQVRLYSGVGSWDL